MRSRHKAAGVIVSARQAAGDEVLNVIEAWRRCMAGCHQRIDERFVFSGDLHRECLGITVPLLLGPWSDDG